MEELKERLLNKIKQENGCWIWTGTRRGNYGAIRVLGHVESTHRMSYLVFTGPLEEGKHIDHLCRKGLCINPEHLELVTSRENTLRGIGVSAINAVKTHCKRGHPFDDANTIAHPKGRNCRTCRNDAQKLNYVLGNRYQCRLGSACVCNHPWETAKLVTPKAPLETINPLKQNA